MLKRLKYQKIHKNAKNTQKYLRVAMMMGNLLIRGVLKRSLQGWIPIAVPVGEGLWPMEGMLKDFKGELERAGRAVEKKQEKEKISHHGLSLNI